MPKHLEELTQEVSYLLPQFKEINLSYNLLNFSKAEGTIDNTAVYNQSMEVMKNLSTIFTSAN